MIKHDFKVVNMKVFNWYEVVISYFIGLAWAACVMAITDYFVLMIYGVKVFFK